MTQVDQAIIMTPVDQTMNMTQVNLIIILIMLQVEVDLNMISGDQVKFAQEDLISNLEQMKIKMVIKGDL